MSSYRTVPSAQTAAKSLNIPTVQTRKLIKMSPSQVSALLRTSSLLATTTTSTTTTTMKPLATQQTQQIQIVSSNVPCQTDNAPLSLEQPCGLFDDQFYGKLYDEFKSEIEKEFEKLNFLFIPYNVTDMLVEEGTSPIIFTAHDSDKKVEGEDKTSSEKPKKTKSKFAEKLNQVSLKH
jgi:hypothetical protein